MGSPGEGLYPRMQALALAFCAMLGLGCGGGSGAGTAVTPPDRAASITLRPVDVTVAAGETATFRVTGDGQPAPVCQWSRDGLPIPGATQTTLNVGPVTALDNQASFSVTLSNSLGSAQAGPATLTVRSAPQIKVQPEDISAGLGATATFRVTAVGTGPLAYQWLANGTVLAGAAEASLAVPVTVANAGIRFAVRVGNALGSVLSREATLKVVAPPAITAHPADQRVLAGQTARFSVQAVAAGTLTYQWLRDGVALPGATDSTLVLPAVSQGEAASQWSVAVSALGLAVVSRQASLAIDPVPQAPAILAGPSDVTILAGADATFRVQATGTAPLATTWTLNGQAQAGATATTFVLKAVRASDDGAVIACSVGNGAGSARAEARLRVLTAGQVPPSADLVVPLWVAPGQQAIQAVAPAGSGFSYRWTVLNGTASANVTAQGPLARLDIGVTAGSFSLELTVTNGAGVTSTASRTITVARQTWLRPYPEEPGMATLGQAVRLNSGFVLFIGNSLNGVGYGERQGCQLYDPATGTWGPCQPTLSPRGIGYTATVLADGRVLVLGGGIDNSAELYDPSTGLWKRTTSAGPLTEMRTGHSAIRLASGQVLVLGGMANVPQGNYGTPLTSCLLFDPVSETWTATGAMATARYAASTLLLADGRVLVAGHGDPLPGYLLNGWSGSSDQCELYDPASGRWSTTGSLLQARGGNSAELLADGWVLVAGGLGPGFGGSKLATCELWNPVTGRWQATGSLAWPSCDQATAPCPDGTVLLAGGRLNYYADTPFSGHSQRYDPATGQWVVESRLLAPLAYASLLALGNGKLLLAGGLSEYGVNATAAAGRPYVNVSEFDPGTARWTPVAPFFHEFYAGGATLLGTGSILLSGGDDFFDEALSRCALVDPASGRWTDAAPLRTARKAHGATLLRDGRVAVTGGEIHASWNSLVLGPTNSLELYDPSRGEWSEGPSMSGARSGHSATLLKDGRLLVAGRSELDGPGPEDAEIFDPVTGKWLLVGPMVHARKFHTATLLAGSWWPGAATTAAPPRRKSSIPPPSSGPPPREWRHTGCSIPPPCFPMAGFWWWAPTPTAIPTPTLPQSGSTRSPAAGCRPRPWSIRAKATAPPFCPMAGCWSPAASR